MPKRLKDTDFMNELEAVRRESAGVSAGWMLYVVVLLLAVLLIGAWKAELDIVARGQGQVVPEHEIQVVQSLEGGILEELPVREGQRVEKGDVLLRISDVHFSSEEQGTKARYNSLSIRKIRLEAEAQGIDFSVSEELSGNMPDIYKNESELYDSRKRELQNAIDILESKISKNTADLAEIDSRIASFRDSLSLLRDEMEITEKMVAQKAVPKIEEIRLQREISEISGNINAAIKRKNGIRAELGTLRKEKENQNDKFRTQVLDELSKTETEIAALEENLRSIGDKVQRTELRSPVSGVINSIAVTTIGGVIEPAQRLVEIVPLGDELKIVAKISPNDIAFLEKGQNAKVTITAYDARRYGTLEGKLTRIGANSTTDRDGNIFFEVEVKTNQNWLGDEDNKLPVTSGMVASVDIVTGKRTVLEYLIKPFYNAFNTAMRER